MKSKFLLFLTFILLLGCSTTKYDVVRKIDKNIRTLAPPGTIWLKDSLFMDKREMSCIAYREYSYWTKRNYGIGSEGYKKTIPDTTLWIDSIEVNYNTRYLISPKFNYYPAIGISYSQAVDYCKWRTDRVKEMYELKYHDNYKKYPKNFQYRLPTKEEWEYAAKAGLDISQNESGYERIFSKKNQPKLMTSEYRTLLENDNNRHLELINFGFPNKYGIENLIGNVAEMISDSGIAKGGSWAHTMKESRILYDVKYNKPTNWLGFRGICEIYEDKIPEGEQFYKIDIIKDNQWLEDSCGCDLYRKGKSMQIIANRLSYLQLTKTQIFQIFGKPDVEKKNKYFYGLDPGKGCFGADDNSCFKRYTACLGFYFNNSGKVKSLGLYSKQLD